MREIKNTLMEMKNAFDVPISRLDKAKESINELKDRSLEITQAEMQREKN